MLQMSLELQGPCLRKDAKARERTNCHTVKPNLGPRWLHNGITGTTETLATGCFFHVYDIKWAALALEA